MKSEVMEIKTEEMKMFENVEFGNVRAFLIDGEPWFCGVDIAKALGYENYRMAVPRNVDEEDRMSIRIRYASKMRKVTVVSESGMYALIFGSKKKDAKKFRRWVTSEVLPSIRKHGAYMTDVTIDKLVENPDLIIELCNKLKAEKQKVQELTEENTVQKQQLAEYEPKATYYDLVLQATDVIPITVIAKDYEMTAHEMNMLLHKAKIQYRVGRTWVLYERYQNDGYTKTKTHTHEDSYGNSHITVHTYWTQKGRLFVYETLKQIGYLPVIEREDAKKGTNK